jgi:energy-converting hydrogenase Eha subunit B
MTRRLKTKLLIGVAVVAVAGGVTAAVVMAAQPAASHHRGGTLATAAGYLGTSPAQLRSELQAGKSLAAIADATPGKSEAGLIAALEAASKQRLAAAVANLPRLIAAEVDRVGGPAARHERAGARVAGRGHALAAAAGYLDLSTAKLRDELRSGHTLAQVAKATVGRSEAGLIEALVAARKAALATKVKAGKITPAEAASVPVPILIKRVTAEVNRARR